MEAIQQHILFGALTRPAMTAGVTYEYHLLNLMMSMCAFIAFNPLYGLIFLPIHVFGWLVCRQDPHLFALVFKRFTLLPALPNHTLWGVRAYEPV